MKKLLAFLGAFGMSVFATTPLVACNKTESNNLSRVKTIAAPASVTASNEEQVTVEEVKAALKDNVLKAVQGVVKTVASTDFVFKVYKDKDNKGTKYEPVNLKTAAQPVFVQITPAKDKTVVIGKSGYIKVTLPKAGTVTKANIKDVTVAAQEVKIKAAAPASVTKAELEAVNTDTALAKAVLDAVQAKAYVTVTADEYTITNDGAEKGDYAAGKDVTEIVEAKESSANITGKFTFTAKVTAEPSNKK